METFSLWTDVKYKGGDIRMTVSQTQPLGYVFGTVIHFFVLFFLSHFFLSFFFFLLLNTLEHPFLTFFFSNPLPSPLECPFAPVGLSCFPGKRKEGRERARACKLNSIVIHYGSAEQARQLHAG